MGWHGVAAIYYEWDTKKGIAVRKSLYLDQILSNNNKQDTVCVVSLLEVFISALVSNFSHCECGFIKNAIICSDNAGCYASYLSILMIGILNSTHHEKMFIQKLIHSETQDGKDLVDAHFAKMVEHLIVYVKHSRQNMIHHIKSPRGLAAALAWNNGVANSIVQLVEVGRDRLEKVVKMLTPMCKKLQKYFSRVSDVHFECPTQIEKEIMNNFDWSVHESFDTVSNELKKNVNLRFKAQAHSGFGEKNLFTVDLGLGNVEPEEK